VRLRRQIVDLVRLSLLDDANEIGWSHRSRRRSANDTEPLVRGDRDRDDRLARY
jgi:hypothetical protein